MLVFYKGLTVFPGLLNETQACASGQERQLPHELAHSSLLKHHNKLPIWSLTLIVQVKVSSNAVVHGFPLSDFIHSMDLPQVITTQCWPYLHRLL